MDEIVQEFLVESHETLDQLDRDLVALEQSPTSKDLLSRVFRTIHTIKGTSGFLAFSQLGRVTHAGESTLSKLRDGALTLTPEVTSTLLDMVDVVRSILGDIERTGAEGETDHTAIVDALTALHRQTDAEVTPAGQVPLLGEALVAQGMVSHDDVALAVNAQRLGDDRRLGEILVAKGLITEGAIKAALDAQGSARTAIADSTVRVDVELLDKLMNLVGELVLTRNQIVQGAERAQDPDLTRSSHRLDLIAGELQHEVMRTRMQPIDTVWSKLPRIVRDLAAQLDKSVSIQTEGGDTELDRTILEAVKDPLTHLVRNAVDHGLESREARLAAGKPEQGTLTLRTFHEDGQVNIEIRDDGAGIDVRRLGDRAIARGVLSADAVARLSDREACALVFTPGLTTAQSVTSVSGRGVGMDVVKTNIEKIGGQVDVQSVQGRGTTIRIKIPLTLAIIPALVVRTGGLRYAIPQVNLLELVRLDDARSDVRVESIQGTPVYRLRGRLLPLVSLREQLGLQMSPDPVGPWTSGVVAVLEAAGRRFGLVVDEIEDTEEIVVKPLSRALRHIPFYAGATIMGDGQVALILDTVAVGERAGALTESVDAVVPEPDTSDPADRLQLLLVALRDGRRLGLPMAAVERLEEFDETRIERFGGRDVVQYRDGVVPLVWLEPAGVLPSYPLQVVVCRHTDTSMGFVVDRVLDIADADPTDGRAPVPTLGRASAVVDGRITELVDLDGALADLEADTSVRSVEA